MGRGLVPAAKREARLAASGWRSAPRERRERRTAGAGGAPEDKSPEVEAPVAQGGLGDVNLVPVMEVEILRQHRSQDARWRESVR